MEWFEEKETAAKQGRPLFDAMMKLLRGKKAVGVIIHKIDRSARNLKDWADLGNLIDQGVEVHFAHESLDLQARGGRLSADIQAVIAADYIRNLRQEAIKGLYGRLKQGIYPFHAPLGYLNHGKGKYKTVDPVQGPLVRKAFELYATQKYSLITLAAHMQELGLKNRKQKNVNVNGLSLMLNNPFYIGILKVKKLSFTGGHEPLISPQLFSKVRAVLQGKTNQKITKHEFKFRKLIKCKKCGYSLVAEIQKGHIYYRCHTKSCTTKGMREVTIENILLNNLRLAQLHPEECEILTELLKELELDWLAKQQELLAVAKLNTGQVLQRLDRLTDCYVEGGLDKETYERRKDQLLIESKAKEAFEKELLYGKEAILKRVQIFLELSKRLIKSYEKGIFDEQRELIEITTSNLVVEDKKLVITMRSPFFELAERHIFHSSRRTPDMPRKTHQEFVDLKKDISPVISEPLNRAELKSFLDTIIQTIEKLPEPNRKHLYFDDS